MNLVPSVQQIEAEMAEWRCHIHAHAELGFEEHDTAGFVAQKLRSWGIETVEGVGRTGVVGTLRGKSGKGASIGIRADMDALPMHEATGLPYASQNANRMHACGHDGHTAMLLGAAYALAKSPDFAGTVHFIFQPAEEGLGGAKAMLADGLFERFPCEEVYALHNSERRFGQVIVHERALAAACDRFEITIHGAGGHAAMPHLACNPIPIAARILLDIEALPGRIIDAMSPAIVTVGAVKAGEAFNTIPPHATLIGTVRCFDPAIRESLENAIRKIVNNHAEMRGAHAEIDFKTLFAPTINTPEQARFLAKVAAGVVGEENILRDPPPEMGSEDFSFMLQERPGCYFMLGYADAEHQAFLHDTKYDFNNGILPIGASIWVRLVEERLKPAG
ncbi:MAG TPA: M20 aminoacylase family protein [Dongiaceae bacterium]|nr:M20 aminoacylase family protein [Dongiaceae bacterium]